MVICLFGRCGFGKESVFYYKDEQIESPTARQCNLHHRQLCCLSCDGMGYKHCTVFCCPVPSPEAMLAASHPSYHKAKQALATGNFSTLEVARTFCLNSAENITCLP